MLRSRLAATAAPAAPVLRLCELVYDPTLLTAFKVTVTPTPGCPATPTLSTSWRFSDANEGLATGFLLDYIYRESHGARPWALRTWYHRVPSLHAQCRSQKSSPHSHELSTDQPGCRGRPGRFHLRQLPSFPSQLSPLSSSPFASSPLPSAPPPIFSTHVTHSTPPTPLTPLFLPPFHTTTTLVYVRWAAADKADQGPLCPNTPG
jgi:hypothetical protein